MVRGHPDDWPDTAVSDLVASVIVDSYIATGSTQVMGTRNRMPKVVSLNGLRWVMPDFNHLGLIYEPQADNSLRKFEEVRALSEEENFQLSTVPVHGDDPDKLEQMAMGIAQTKVDGVKLIYLGSSPFLETRSDTFTQMATSHGLPAAVYSHR
ncbi:hypothetical protein FEE96_07265 [Parasedimentitalea maritima]|uniref:Amidohydrolase-related domain-containing protein n=1 Tax=Parasedimentitalea maritima TaxID=2578117 RepID=A0ABY2UX02_9RHOB|nr:hypothetical protein FEE96_07265 [Zongyanglinia marina]